MPFIMQTASDSVWLSFQATRAKLENISLCMEHTKSIIRILQMTQ